MNSVKIFLRTDRLNKNGTHTIYVRLIAKRRKKDFSLHIFVKPKDWSSVKNLVEKTDPNYLRKNKLIKKFKNKAENIVDDCFFNIEKCAFSDNIFFT